MDEKKTLYEAQNGNKYALNMLLSENFKILKGYVLKMTGNIDEAQDIVQETLLKAVLNIKKFEPNVKFSTWLIKISINVYRDWLRKRKKEMPIDDNLINENFNIEESIVKKIEYKKALEILKSMPWQKRAAFILKYYYNYKYEEISEILDCPVGTVRSRLYYCTKEIIKQMEESDYDEN